jgi:hypothetical protein
MNSFTSSMLRIFLTVSLVLGLTTQLHAKTFTSQFCEFELPPGWECALEGTEWVCQSTNADRKKEAIIILAAKIAGAHDSLDAYQAHLNQTKTFMLPGGKTQVSEPKFTNIRSINNHRWVDSLHLASEVPGFYTRYLATVKEDLGVAVTFSVAKDFYSNYEGVINALIESLRVFRSKSTGPGQFAPVAGGNVMDNVTFAPDDGRNDIGVGRQKKGGVESDDTGTYAIILLLVLGGAFAMMKLRKKKGGAATAKKKKKSAPKE